MKHQGENPVYKDSRKKLLIINSNCVWIALLIAFSGVSKFVALCNFSLYLHIGM